MLRDILIVQPPKTMMRYTKKISEAITQTPALRQPLEKICGAYGRKLQLPKTLKLGVVEYTLSRDNALFDLFGHHALKIGPDGAAVLSFAKLFTGWEDEDINRWVEDLHLVLGLSMPKTDYKMEAYGKLDILLEQWRLSYPRLADVYVYLKSRYAHSPAMIKKVKARGVEPLKARWFKAGEIVTFLLDNAEATTLSDLGARFCNDSKALRSGALLGLVTEALAVLEGEVVAEGKPGGAIAQVNQNRETLLERYNIVSNPSAVKVTFYGPIVYYKKGRKLDYAHCLFELGETATLSLDNLADIERIELPAGMPVLSCENESPFYALVRNKWEGVVVYTQGFPNTAVKKLWSLLYNSRPSAPRYHWGDSDLAGLRIAAILHSIGSLALWRCDVDELRRNRGSLTSLGGKEKKAAAAYLKGHPDFAFKEELTYTLQNGWLEQEAWLPVQIS